MAVQAIPKEKDVQNDSNMAIQHNYPESNTYQRHKVIYFVKAVADIKC